MMFLVGISAVVISLWNLRNMAASYLPSIFVPLVGLVLPAVSMALLFIYIQREESAES